MRHRVQHFLMATGNQTRGSQDLEHRDFRFHVLSQQTLRDRVDRRRVSEHVRSASLKNTNVKCYSVVRQIALASTTEKGRPTPQPSKHGLGPQSTHRIVHQCFYTAN